MLFCHLIFWLSAFFLRTGLAVFSFYLKVSDNWNEANDVTGSRKKWAFSHLVTFQNYSRSIFYICGFLTKTITVLKQRVCGAALIYGCVILWLWRPVQRFDKGSLNPAPVWLVLGSSLGPKNRISIIFHKNIGPWKAEEQNLIIRLSSVARWLKNSTNNNVSERLFKSRSSARLSCSSATSSPLHSLK